MRIAFLLTEQPGLPSPDAVLAAHRKLAPRDPALSVLSATDEALELESAAGERFHVGAMPGPVPEGEADAMAPFSVSAMGTDWSPEPHVAHLVVVHQPQDGAEALSGLVHFTRVLAALSDAAPCVGLYLGDARATHEPAFFRELSTEELPVALWTGVSVATPDAQHVSLLSLGMRALNLPNLQLLAPRRESDAALAFFFDLLTYVVRRGEALPEGDTVGRTPDEKIVVRYDPSPIVDGDQVMLVELPASRP